MGGPGSGWFGDPEGHAKAGEQGGRESRGSRSSSSRQSSAKRSPRQEEMNE